MNVYLWRFPQETRGYYFYIFFLDKSCLLLELEYSFSRSIALQEPVGVMQNLNQVKYHKIHISLRMEHELIQQRVVGKSLVRVAQDLDEKHDFFMTQQGDMMLMEDEHLTYQKVANGLILRSGQIPWDLIKNPCTQTIYGYWLYHPNEYDS